MIQIIGFIVAVYAMTRLGEIAFVLYDEKGPWNHWAGIGICVFGFGVLVILTALLFLSGIEIENTLNDF